MEEEGEGGGGKEAESRGREGVKCLTAARCFESWFTWNVSLTSIHNLFSCL